MLLQIISYIVGIKRNEYEIFIDGVGNVIMIESLLESMWIKLYYLVMIYEVNWVKTSDQDGKEMLSQKR